MTRSEISAAVDEARRAVEFVAAWLEETGAVPDDERERGELAALAALEAARTARRHVQQTIDRLTEMLADNGVAWSRMGFGLDDPVPGSAFGEMRPDFAGTEDATRDIDRG